MPKCALTSELPLIVGSSALCMQAIRFQARRKHELRIAVFGDNTGRIQSCMVVKIGIATRERCAGVDSIYSTSNM